MASTDLTARFSTKALLLQFAEEVRQTPLVAVDYEYRKVSVVRDYPWQIDLRATHPGEVSLGAMAVQCGGEIISLTMADTPVVADVL